MPPLFFRAAEGAVSGHPHSLYDARKALTAQARYRATFKIPLALRAVAGDTQKFPNSSERTFQAPKTPCSDNSLPGEALPVQAPAPRPSARRPPRRGTKWSPEHRARQALAIRTWQPWRKSTGPRTQDGKARSAKNPLKHGYRSRPISKPAAKTGASSSARPTIWPPQTASSVQCRNNAIACRSRACHAEARRAKAGHSIGIGRPTFALIPSRLANSRGIAVPAERPAVRLWRTPRDDDGGSRHDEEDIEHQGRQG